MWIWIVQRLKMVAGATAAAATIAALKAIETSFGFDFPEAWEIAIVALVTGLFVERIPNKT